MFASFARVLRLALALASELGAVTSRVLVPAVTRLASVRRINGHTKGAIVSRLALFTVDSIGIVLTVLAHASALIFPVHVNAELLLFHFGIVDAAGRVIVALARFAFELLLLSVLTPELLREAVAASLTLIPARVMLATAVKFT